VLTLSEDVESEMDSLEARRVPSGTIDHIGFEVSDIAAMAQTVGAVLPPARSSSARWK